MKSQRISATNLKSNFTYSDKYFYSERTMPKATFLKNTLLVFLLISVLWVVYFIQYMAWFDFTPYGNWPQHRKGLIGILFSPFIHGSFEHLISNTLPMIVLLSVMLNAYPRVALVVLVFVHLASGALVWLLAPDTGVHIGISGIIYGMASFLVASGLFRKDRGSVTIALLVAMMYGGMLLGFIPEKGVSWQSHLFGALSGIFIAFVLRKVDVPPKHEFENEPEEKDEHFFEQKINRQ